MSNRAIILIAVLVLSICAAGAEDRLVQINAEIVEVDVAKTLEYGIKWVNTLRTQEGSVPGVFDLGDFVRLNQVYSDIKMLTDEGAADLLATPKLVTKNGTVARFNAGGEIPYIMTTSVGAVHVEFKEYGVMLKIKPTIEKEEMIDLDIEAEVSAPSEYMSVMYNGNVVPALTSRKVESKLNIKSGTTITLAGLNQTRKETTKVGVPVLSDIPLLGALFSWRKIINKKTSVIIFITPSLL